MNKETARNIIRAILMASSYAAGEAGGWVDGTADKIALNSVTACDLSFTGLSVHEILEIAREEMALVIGSDTEREVIERTNDETLRTVYLLARLFVSEVGVTDASIAAFASDLRQSVPGLASLEDKHMTFLANAALRDADQIEASAIFAAIRD